MKNLGLALMLVLVAISAIGPMALNGVLPATTAIMVDLSTRYELVQLVLTAYLLANLLSQLVLGPAADRFGRRPIMLLSLCIFCVGSFVCAKAPSIEWLIGGRFLQGIGGAVCAFLPRAVVRDVYSQNKAASVIGYITTAMMVAPLFAPAVGGWITDQFSWRWMYYGLSLLGAVLVVLTYRFQYETLGTQKGADELTVASAKVSWIASSKVLLSDSRFVACAIMQAGTIGVYYGFLSGAPYVAMESRGLSASEYGIWFSTVATGYLTGNLVAGRFSESQGVYRMIILGTVPFVLGGIMFWVGAAFMHPAALFLPMFLVALSNGMSLPSMFSLGMSVRPEFAASASGIAGSLQTAVGVLLSVALGYLLPFSELWLFIVISVSMALSLSGLWFTLRLNKP